MITRTITNAGAPFKYPDGSIAANIKVLFTLVRNTGLAVDVFDQTSFERIAPGPVIVKTDATGVFSVDLFPTDRADQAVYYLCQVPELDNVVDFVAPLPTGGTLSWYAFKALAGAAPFTPAAQTALDIHMANVNNPHQVTTEQIMAGVFHIGRYASFAAALANSETAGKTIFVDQPITIAANTTIPANRNIIRTPAAAFAINVGATLTINGDFEMETKHPPFTGGGALVFGRNVNAPAMALWPTAMSVTFANGQDEIKGKWFGAAGDGTTNDRLAIQAALDACGTAGGGIVSLGTGTFNVLSGTSQNSALSIPSGVTVRGSGWKTVLKHYSGIVSAVIANKNSSPYMTAVDTDVCIKDIAIDCGSLCNMGVAFYGVVGGSCVNVRVISPHGYGIWMVRRGDEYVANVEGYYPAKNIIVSGCYVTGIVDVGVECDGAIGCTVTGNVCGIAGTSGNTGIGFSCWNGSTDCTFTGNTVFGEAQISGEPYGRGFHIGPRGNVLYATATARNTFTGNTIRGVGIGFRLPGQGDHICDTIITGNTIKAYNKTNGNFIGIDIDGVYGLTFSDNFITDFYRPIVHNNINAGALWDNNKDVNIINNRFSSGQQSTLWGFIDSKFIGNSFVDIYGHELMFLSAQRSIFANNTFRDPNFVAGFNYGMIFDKYLTNESLGNIITGNKTIDTNSTKSLWAPVLLNSGSDYNIVSLNNSYGARSGAPGYTDSSTGTHNVFANNINNP